MTSDECDPLSGGSSYAAPGTGLARALAQGRLVGGLARAGPGGYRLRSFRQGF